MWVKTQGKSELVKVIKFTAVKVFSGKNKGMIYGKFAGSSIFHENSVLLGKYSTYEEAMKELGNIENALEEDSNTIYQVK